MWWTRAVEQAPGQHETLTRAWRIAPASPARTDGTVRGHRPVGAHENSASRSGGAVRGRVGLGAGEGDDERRAAPVVRDDVDGPAVRHHDLAGDVEAETEAARAVAGVERV